MGVRQRKKAMLRQRILDVSVAAFRDRGYDTVTVDEICNQLGISKATFFRYFATKDAILSEFAETMFREFETTVMSDGERCDPSSRLRHFYDLVASMCARDTKLVAAIIDSGAIDPARHVADWVGPDAELTVVGRILSEGQKTGVFRRRLDARTLALVVETAAHTVIAAWIRADSDRAPQPEFASFVEVFFEGALVH